MRNGIKLFLCYYHSEKPDEIEIIEEGFSIYAGIFSVFWLIYKKATWYYIILASIFFSATPYFLGFNSVISGAFEVMAFGIFGNELIQLSLNNKGYQLADIISAYTPEEAEIRFHQRLQNDHNIISTNNPWTNL